MAVALQEAAQPAFTTYIQQVQQNARALARCLQNHNYTIVTNGTDNHIVLWDVHNTGLSGAKLEKALEWCEISANKNAIFGDTSALSPGGVRLGTPAMTTRGMNATDMMWVGNIIHEIVQLAQQVHVSCQKINHHSYQVSAVSEERLQDPAPKPAKLHQFIAEAQNEPYWSSFVKLREEVTRYVKKFPMPGLVP